MCTCFEQSPVFSKLYFVAMGSLKLGQGQAAHDGEREGGGSPQLKEIAKKDICSWCDCWGGWEGILRADLFAAGQPRGSPRNLPRSRLCCCAARLHLRAFDSEGEKGVSLEILRVTVKPPPPRCAAVVGGQAASLSPGGFLQRAHPAKRTSSSLIKYPPGH